MHEGRPADAEKIMRGLVPAPKLPDFESEVRASLANALLAQGLAAEAQSQISLATRLLRRTGPVSIGLDVRLAHARLLAASKRPNELAASQRELNSIVKDARGWGLLEPQLQARLTLGALEAKHGKGTSLLEALQKEAQAKGYLAIAQSATRAMGSGI